jgi:hypothetical protein
VRYGIGPRLNKENIPTIIELIDHPEDIEALARETLAQWSGKGGHTKKASEDPETFALATESLQHDEAFGQGEAQKARDELRKAIDDARAILSCQRLAGIMNLRHQHLAHSLSETSVEKATGPVAPMKYGDEREILSASLPIVEALHRRVSGTSFSFENSRKIDRKNAEALWKRCTFAIQN